MQILKPGHPWWTIKAALTIFTQCEYMTRRLAIAEKLTGDDRGSLLQTARAHNASSSHVAVNMSSHEMRATAGEL